MLYAHTPNEEGKWHSLEQHLLAVSEAAERFAAPFGGADLARLVGLWHDLGKGSQAFQRYLAQCAAEPGRRFRSVDHKGAGALAALAYFEPLAYLVQGHHGGLRDQEELRTWLKSMGSGANAERIADAVSRVQAEGIVMPDVQQIDPSAIPSFITNELELEMFLRLLFSTLVDADHLDTEAHTHPKRAGLRREPPPLSALASRLDVAQAELSGQADDPVNRIRHEVYLASLAAAEEAPGLFRLTVPTGGGKTRSALAFALHHAVRHDLGRVIVVSPFLTITDQTADVYRSILGEGVVLEHHSDAGRFDDPEGEPTPEAVWRRLATQNWDAAVVVTTAVQFFESLFGNRTSTSRKLHRIARSVVILDEPQTLPAPLLDPIADGIRQLTEHYGATVVLCTATQPALESVPALAALPPAREIAPDPPRLFSALKRVDYHWPALDEPWTWEETAVALRSESQALCVVNTRPDALALLEALGDSDALHLSTLLCGAHRRDVLALIRKRLERGLACRVVSTQVVEAGVDLDFPVVFRAMGPLDRIAQAAGRCNREGRLPRGRVVVFRPADGSVPAGPYRTATDLTGVALGGGGADPDDPDTFERYFKMLYSSVAVDAKAIQDERRRLNFETVAEKFRMIPDDTVSVLVTYRGMGQEEEVDHVAIVAEIEREVMRSVTYGTGTPARGVMARAQPYLVNLRRRTVERQLVSQGLVEEIAPEIWRWRGGYDPVVGIGRMDASVWDAADFVIA